MDGGDPGRTLREASGKWVLGPTFAQVVRAVADGETMLIARADVRSDDRTARARRPGELHTDAARVRDRSTRTKSP
jgi:hypothetical protein